MKRLLTAVIYGLTGFIGIVAFAYPFLLPTLWRGVGSIDRVLQPMNAHQTDAPLVTLILIVLCLVALVVEIQGQAVSSKVVAALGVMVAVTSVLRFIEVALPGPGGFSLIFAPIILAGYVFGTRFGFLLGVMALLVSALVTGNVGPWLPYQMFASGWIGMTAGWLPRPTQPTVQLVMLALFSFIWGMLFGAIMNLYFWPFLMDDTITGWQPGIGFGTGLKRYLAFYLATSLVWDIGRAAGNTFFVLVLGMPMIRALSRFRERFEFRIA